MEDELNPRWRKSSYSGNGGGTCILAANIGETVAVKDSTISDSPVLRFSAPAWRELLNRVRSDSTN
jgi:hypothetical protein